MNYARLVPVLICLMFIVGGACASAPPMRGVVLNMNCADPDFDYTPLIKEIADTGATHVSLFIPYYQADAESTGIHAMESKTPARERIEETMDAAHAAGLQIMIFPVVLLEKEGGTDWRGTLRPTDTDAWFANYESVLLDLARVSESHGAALLSVGSEFGSLQTESDRWRALCGRVRSEFSGKLIYTANWDAIESLDWWDAVDYMGVSSYFELAPQGDFSPSEATIRLNWQRWKKWILEVRADVAPGKPMIFAEVGYPSINGAAARPWDYGSTQPEDFEEQRLCFQIFTETWDDAPELAGAFVYTWIEFGKDGRRDYSQRGKPAEQIIRAWYHGPINRFDPK